MTDTVRHECTRCEKPTYWRGGCLPPRWTTIAGAPVCEDCGGERDAELPIGASADKACQRTETAMRLLSGGYLDIADPDCSLVQPIDLAAGLRNARFCGQTRQFYTIAQHSLLVLRLVAPIARSLGGDKGLQLRRCALMHDSAEGLIHDITRPLKIQLADYRAIEARFETRLADRFGWEWTDWRRETVKRADLQALAIEQRDLIGEVDDWPILDSIDRADLTGIKITRCWHPDEAQDRFLAAFDDLFGADKRLAA